MDEEAKFTGKVKHGSEVISRETTMKPKPWKTLSTKMVYENPWMRLREDIAELPNGRTTIYGVVVFGDCVGIHFADLSDFSFTIFFVVDE